MAIIQSDVLGLDLTYLGQPYADLIPAGTSSLGLDLTYLGQPFYAPESSAAPPAAYNATQFFAVFY